MFSNKLTRGMKRTDVDVGAARKRLGSALPQLTRRASPREPPAYTQPNTDSLTGVAIVRHCIDALSIVERKLASHEVARSLRHVLPSTRRKEAEFTMMTMGLLRSSRIHGQQGSVVLPRVCVQSRYLSFIAAAYVCVACSSGGTDGANQNAAAGGSGANAGGSVSVAGGAHASSGGSASGGQLGSSSTLGPGGGTPSNSSSGTGGQNGIGGRSTTGQSSTGGPASTGGVASSGGTTAATGHTSTGGAVSAAGGSGKASGGASASITGGAASGGTGGAKATTTVPTGQAAYFVAPTGNDSNPGTLDEPFATISKARDVVRTINTAMTGDVYVYLRGGNYGITSPIAFTAQDSGTGGHRVYYQAYPGEVPVLNGATQVSGWTLSSGSIYKAPLNRTTKLRNLYVNDKRASMTSKTVSSKGGTGTYSVTAGQAAWAWSSGNGSDGIKYATADVPAIASNKDDLEIVNGTTWNENIVCTRDVVTTTDGYRGLLLQQPYGAIAQLPSWNAGFSVSGSHTIFNAYEFLNSPGQFYFDKTTKTLYYYPRSGENMETADVEAPTTETLITIAGTSTTSRVKNITFQGITFANTDYNLYNVAGSSGKATVQGATVYIAYGDGNWHNSKYQITDVLPGMITVNNADSIHFVGNVVKHSGNEGLSLINDVVNSNITGNFISDIAGSGITVGHPQHVYIGDGGTHEKYAKGVEGVCSQISITNNFIYDVSTQRGFGGHAGVTAFFVDTLSITHNHIHTTAYNGINLGWGWRNFTDSTTCKNNNVSYNRFNNTLNRLHDSGAIYTIGQMPGTTINQNYVKGIPPATSGPTYGLHNDEGSAYITENDNVLDIDPAVKYTINCEDYGAKHDLTILRTYATVNKMGATPPKSTIDPPVVVSDNVWPATQYGFCLNSGVEEAYRSLIPSNLMATQDYVFPASCAVAKGTATLSIRSSGDDTRSVWLAPAGTTAFAEGATMTKASGTATSIAVPATAGTYKLFVVDSQGKKLGESTAQLRVK